MVAATEAIPALNDLPGVGRHILVFADADALRVLQAVTEHRPNLVVLQRQFLATPRCASLIARIRTDSALSHAQIRVLANVNEYIHLVSRRAQAGLELDTAMPGEPLPTHYDGAQTTRRFKMRPDVEVRLDEYVTALVNLSHTGVQLLVPKALRLNQQVRVSIEDEVEIFRLRAAVA